jgi:phosphoglycerol geranylgeranyltransferase
MESSRLSRRTLSLGTIENLITERISKEGAILFTLLDPERTSPGECERISAAAEKAGSAGIMIGGSTLSSVDLLNNVIRSIKQSVKLPVIIFPNNITSVSPYADAIWFMSLLNSINPYFIIGAQALGAPIIRESGLEAIPLGYLIIGEGGAAGFMGQANPIPYDKPEIAAMYALAAHLLGMRFVYLEAGSGVKSPIPPNMIHAVKKATRSRLVVGGGIRTKEDAFQSALAGADILVTGTAIEDEENAEENISKFVDGIRLAVERRKVDDIL